jgi:peroxiredoxin
MLEVGELAPEFHLASTGGEDVRLSDAVERHQATVVAFYVLDFTPG